RCVSWILPVSAEHYIATEAERPAKTAWVTAYGESRDTRSQIAPFGILGVRSKRLTPNQETTMYEFKEIPTGWKGFWGMYEEETQPMPPKAEATITILRLADAEAGEWAYADLRMSA